MSVLAGMRGSPVEVVTGISGGTNAATPICVVLETDTMLRSTAGTVLMSKIKILALENSMQNCSSVPQLLYWQKKEQDDFS